MQHNSQIIIQQLSYLTTDNKAIFNNLSLSFGLNKVGMVGKNGIGKSTLLKLIMGELVPNSGAINVSGKISYCPQDFSSCLKETIAQVFGIEQKLQALDRITQGSVDEHDFEIVEDDWNIQENINQQLEKFGLININLKQKLNTLSGGQITRLWLAKIFYINADIIILDEPTNNLDLSSRKLLYNAIQAWSGGLLVVTHDRELLNHMDQIVELTTLGANIYGGNYDHYVAQKKIEQTAKQRQLDDAKKLLTRTKQTVQATREKCEQRAAHGRKMRKTGSQAKIVLDKMKETSGQTQGQLSIRENRLLTAATDSLQKAKATIEISETDTRHYLAQFLFRNKDALKLAGNLSGGEKLCALLACVLMSKQPPQLIILDEPTNHLDLDSINAIESALKCYQGAIIAISHDKQFVKNIQVTKIINLSDS